MTPGIYKNINIEDYHEDRTVISSTSLREAKKSTRKFIYYLIHGSENKPVFDFGNAFEIAVIDKVNGTSDFEKTVAVMHSQEWVDMALTDKPTLEKPKASKVYKDIKDSFLDRNKDKYIIEDSGTPESLDALNCMVESCLSDKVVGKLLEGTEYQTTLVWKDEATNLLCKTRPDLNKQKKEILVDIKTANDASTNGFARACADHDYFLQACMQIDGAIKSGLMENVDLYLWLAVEKKPPYDYGLFQFEKEDIVWCMDHYHFYLDRCAKAIDKLREAGGDISAFSSYGEAADNKHGILPIRVPLWYKT